MISSCLSVFANGVNTKTENKPTWRLGYRYGLNWKIRRLFWTKRQLPVKSPVVCRSRWSMSSHVACKKTLQIVPEIFRPDSYFTLLGLVLFFSGFTQLWCFYLKVRGKTKCYWTLRDSWTVTKNWLFTLHFCGQIVAVTKVIHLLLYGGRVLTRINIISSISWKSESERHRSFELRRADLGRRMETSCTLTQVHDSREQSSIF